MCIRDSKWGLLLEWLWHVIFGQPWVAWDDPDVARVVHTKQLEELESAVVGRPPCIVHEPLNLGDFDTGA